MFRDPFSAATSTDGGSPRSAVTDEYSFSQDFLLSGGAPPQSASWSHSYDHVHAVGPLQGVHAPLGLDTSGMTIGYSGSESGASDSVPSPVGDVSFEGYQLVSPGSSQYQQSQLHLAIPPHSQEYYQPSPTTELTDQIAHFHVEEWMHQGAPAGMAMNSMHMGVGSGMGMGGMNMGMDVPPSASYEGGIQLPSLPMNLNVNVASAAPCGGIGSSPVAHPPLSHPQPQTFASHDMQESWSQWTNADPFGTAGDANHGQSTYDPMDPLAAASNDMGGESMAHSY